MKVGNKVICIKDNYDLKNRKLNNKGSFYDIIFMGKENRIYISNETLLYDTVCVLEDPLFEYLLFSDYFATLKENRKQKLEKLRKINAIEI